MSHASRPIPARRIFAQYSDAEIARRDQADDDRRNSYRMRPACRDCGDKGCPACWGLGELDGEYDEQEDES